MRRTKTTSGISPQQLKHFAVIAVVLTGLLAVFVSGEDWGARAQIEAVNAKNELVAKEAEKLGTKRITSSMTVHQPTNQGFGEEAGPGSLGASSAQAETPPQGPAGINPAHSTQRSKIDPKQRDAIEAASRQRSGNSG